MIANFPFYNMLFVLEILIAEFLFMRVLKRRKHYVLRMAGACVIPLVISFFIPSVSNGWLLSLVYIGLFLATVALMKLCYHEPWVNIFFCALAAYTMQHFSHEFCNFILTIIVRGRSPLFGIYSTTVIEITALNKEAIFWGTVYILCYFMAYTAAYFVFCKPLKREGELKVRNSWLLLLLGVGLFIDIIFNAILVYQAEDVGMVTSLVFAACNGFCCFLLLQVQFSLVHTRKLEEELNLVHKLLDKEKKQYALLNENINVVNIKVHDIKHQIRQIGNENRISVDTIEEIENAVSIYDSFVKTGNEVLDTILTEKNLYCMQNGIILSYMVDGEELDFMKENEVYSLFGNIIDNAVDAVKKVETPSMHIITLKVFAHGNFVIVNLSNYYSGKLEFDEDGLPRTKGDTNYHGFGMKSVRFIVEKYGGSLSVKTKNDIFYLNVLLPRMRTEKSASSETK